MLNDKNLYGLDVFGDSIKEVVKGKVANDYLIPPFSILSARDGFWQDRKSGWLSNGIDSELGRDDNLTFQVGTDDYRGGQHQNLTTSIFDPVLTELSYIWYTRKDAQIIDPFAGGSVRGIVASMVGRNYWGCDLREEQIDANRIQADKICKTNKPIWVSGDSNEMISKAPEADFLFSCPPYGDLEVYSDDPLDISNMSYEEFLKSYTSIIIKSADKLKNNRFACFVVGNFREKKTGFMRDFVGDTIRSFEKSGLHFYNESILATQVASMAMRIKGQFDSSRKVGKTHQNVLVFCKGDPKKATEYCGKVEF